MELKYYSRLVTEDKLTELYSETINQLIDELSKFTSKLHVET